MKIKNKPGQQGSALAICVMITAIVGFSTASYLTFVRTQNLSIARSQAWNEGIGVMEAGVEEAMTQLYYTGVTSLSSNSCTLKADGRYHKQRSIGTAGSYYDVSIQPVNPPTIYSTAYVRTPLSKTSSNYVTRTVRITTKNSPGGGGGLTAKGKILFSGGGSLDSFDSSDPLYSTGGKYDPAKKKAGGAAVTNAKLADSIHVDTAHIYGKATTGPGGTVTVAGGAVGDLAWNLSNSGIQAGTTANDANVQFDDVLAPWPVGTPFNTPGVGTLPLGLTNYTYVVKPGNNQLGSINIGGGKSMAVYGDAILYMTGDFVTSGSGFVYIAPGASLKIYCAAKFTVSGTGVVNGTQNASKLNVYGLNSCTVATYSGSSAFIGTVYMPYADFTFSGSAGASGSFTANTVTITGGAAVHYDEGLKASSNGYVVARWDEI